MKKNKKDEKNTKNNNNKNIGKFKNSELPLCLILGFILNLAIETMARKGVAGFEFLLDKPVVFLYNALFIASTLSIALLFKRKAFFLILISTIWLMIGGANGVILTERMTPFTVKDLYAVTDAATILTNYFNKTKLALIASAIVLTTVGIVLLWLKSPKRERRLGTAILKFASFVALTAVVTGSLVHQGTLATFFGNLAYAYRDYGVAYCFTNTWLNTGIKKPAEYGDLAVRALLPNVEPSEDGNTTITVEDVDEQYPNVIFVQLESFTDPYLFNTIEYSEDAMPYFRSLMDEYSSGYITVPACGAGTANTEFEVSTGLSIKFFGPGEYPFKGILRKAPAESIAFAFKNMGYGTHAIHNHRALFYNRNEVFANIGYDTFTSIEYMSDVPRTPKNWAKDKILTGEILKTMRSTDSRDYIYTISVQGHGKYPGYQIIENPFVHVTDAPTEELKWKYEYYGHQVYEMDLFVKELVAALEEEGEPVVLVLFGDHIPALDVTPDSYDLDLYQTPYVIWDNLGLPEDDKDILAYEIAADVLDSVGIHKGTVMTYHQTHENHSTERYLNGLKMLGYDMLYGERYIYGGQNPFERVDMQMGVDKVEIDKVVNVSGKLYIKGKNFTEFSKVTLDGQLLKTTYLSSTLLILEEEIDEEDVERMHVSQIDRSSKEIISSTE